MLRTYSTAVKNLSANDLTSAKLALLDRHLKRTHFYQKLEKFGFQLVLKPVKMYEDEEGNQKRKANCDVEMAFYLMRDKDLFERVIVLSGDGDFLPVLKHLREVAKKEVIILARGQEQRRRSNNLQEISLWTSPIICENVSRE